MEVNGRTAWGGHREGPAESTSGFTRHLLLSQLWNAVRKGCWSGGGRGGEVGCLVEEIKGSAAVTWFTFRQRQRYRRHTTTADREAHVVTLVPFFF